MIHGQNPDRIVREAAARICASLDVEETMRAIADSAKRALARRPGHAATSTRSRGRSSRASTPPRPTPGGGPSSRRSVGKGQRELPIWRAQLAQPDPILVVEDVGRCEAIPAGLRTGLGSGAFLGVLLEHGSVQDSPGRTLLGTLFVTYRQPRRISTEERSVAGGLANLATLALANARLHAQTLRSLHAAEHQAGTDELTGLCNRRVVEEHLESMTAPRGRAPRGPVGAGLRPGRVQGDQRPPRPRHRRRLPAGGGPRRRDLPAAAATAPAGWAARSSWSCCRRPAPRAPGWWPSACGRASPRSRPRSASSSARASAWRATRCTPRARPRSCARPTPPCTRPRRSGATAASSSTPPRRGCAPRTPAAPRPATRATWARCSRSPPRWTRATPSTHAHSTTVALYAAEIADAPRPGRRPGGGGPDRRAAARHRQGRACRTRCCTSRAGSPTPESAEMRRHPEIGAKLLVHPGVADVRGWVLQHHERPDGKGYPYGLAAATDPPGGAHPRGRRRLRGDDRRPPVPAQPGPPGAARRELEGGRGTQFDERVLDAFLAYLDRPGRHAPRSGPPPRLAARPAISLP